MASQDKEDALQHAVRGAQWTVKTVEGQSRGDPTPKLTWRNGASAIHTLVVANVVKAPIQRTQTRGQTQVKPDVASDVAVRC